jgi:protein SCO1
VKRLVLFLAIAWGTQLPYGHGSEAATGLRALGSGFMLQAAQQTPAAEDTAARRYFTDTILIDQDGVERRFYTDLIQGKTVVINVMFTTCKDSCPMMAANFARMQEWLGGRLGKDAHMISISIDPETDSVPRIKAYAERFKAKPGWFFLGGRKTNVEMILKKLGLYVEQKETHLNVFLIGNDVTGLWKKALGVADSSKLVTVLDSVLNDAR